jgi:Tol biopolymer transport system component
MRCPLPEGNIQAIDQSPNERLDSWKEIAAYFRRDVRTVRRWEQSLGLPVHRHRQRRGVAVYAYKAEVDEWWRLRDQMGREQAGQEQAGRDQTGREGTGETALSDPPQQPGATRNWVWPALAAVAVLGVLFGVWRETSPSPPDTPVPLTSYPGIEEYPSLSPDGNRLAFCWNGDDGRNIDIYIKPLDTSLADPVRLTTDSAPDVNPVWAPDGRTIAFLRQSGPGEMKLMLIPSVGGVERELKTAQVSWERDAGSYLAWTPDGKSLVFLDRDLPESPVGLFAISLESGELRRLTAPPTGWWGDSGPAFSPDGRQLAFSRLKTLTDSDIHLLALTADGRPGGKERRLTTTEHAATNPAWVQGGRDILFVAGNGAEPRIRRISASGSGQPTDVAPDAVLPVFALAGSNLVFSRGSFDTNIWRVELNRASGRAASGASFVASTLNDSWADYCPRGENVVYLSDRSGAPELWISDPQGANSRQLTAFAGPRLAGPRWAPDGEHIVFAAWQDGSADIYTVHSAGGAPAPITDDPAEDMLPSWSSDGRWIYFGSNRNGDWQVWKTPAAVGPAEAGAGVELSQNPQQNPDAQFPLGVPSTPVAYAAPVAYVTQNAQSTPAAYGALSSQVTYNGGNAAMESPDGRFLYFTKGRGATTLWKMPVEGGEETLVAENLFGAANFYVTRDGAYFIARPDEKGGAAKDRVMYSLKYVTFATGRIHRVSAIEQPADLGLAMSPDGRHLLYSQWDQFEADLILQRLPE